MTGIESARKAKEEIERKDKSIKRFNAKTQRRKKRAFDGVRKQGKQKRRTREIDPPFLFPAGKD
jgi:hypothetical protein